MEECLEPKGPPTIYGPDRPPQVSVTKPQAAPQGSPKASARPEPKNKPEPKKAPEAAKAKPPTSPAGTGAKKPTEPSKASEEPSKPEPKASAKPEPKASPEPSKEKSSGEDEKASPAAAADTGVLAELPAPAGTVVCISGLKAAPQLNGTLGQILRPSDTPDRTIVQTSSGEKALKAANIEIGLAAVCPHWAKAVAGVLGTCCAACGAGLVWSGGRSAPCAAAMPLLALAWTTLTLLVCFLFYRPCWPSGTWVPSVSSVANRAPSRTVFRCGVCVAALALATTTWLYGELVMPQILDGPMSPALLEVEQAAGAARDEAPGREDDGHVVEDSEAAPAAEDTDVDGADATKAVEVEDENATANTTIVKKPPRVPPASMIQSSVFHGYVAAAALAAQGLVFYEGRSLQTVIHLLAAVAFACFSFQHCSMSTALLISPRGEPYAESLGAFQSVIRFRQMLADFAPVVLMAAPLMTQMFKNNRPSLNRQTASMMSVLDASGMLLSLRALQWGTIVTYVLYAATYAVDFWISCSAELYPDEETV